MAQDDRRVGRRARAGTARCRDAREPAAVAACAGQRRRDHARSDRLERGLRQRHRAQAASAPAPHRRARRRRADVRRPTGTPPARPRAAPSAGPRSCACARAAASSIKPARGRQAAPRAGVALAPFAGVAARGREQRLHVVEQRRRDVDRRPLRAATRRASAGSASGGISPMLRAAVAAGQELALGGGIGIAELDRHQEAVELRLRQRIGADLLDRVLRGDDEERIGQLARLRRPCETCRSSIASSSALCVFGGARLISSASTTELKIGPGWKRNACAALVEDRHAEHVGGQEVARELDARVLEAERRRERLRERRLADARDVLDQQVAAREQAGEREAQRLVLADDDAGELGRTASRRAALGVPACEAERTVMARVVVGDGRGAASKNVNQLDSSAGGRVHSVRPSSPTGGRRVHLRVWRRSSLRSSCRHAHRLHHPSVVPAARHGAVPPRVPRPAHAIGDRLIAAGLDPHLRALHGAGRDARADRARPRRRLHRRDRSGEPGRRACTTSIPIRRSIRIR